MLSGLIIILIIIGFIFLVGMTYYARKVATLSDGIFKTAVTDENESKFMEEHRRLYGETPYYLKWRAKKLKEIA